MSTSNGFYVAGGSLRADSPSYIDRQADADLYEGLQAGEFCYVLTPRQMGKSSLMVRTAARLREEGVCVVVLDLTAIGRNLEPEQWYFGLLERLGEQLGCEEALEEFWLAHQRLGPCQRFFAALRRVQGPEPRVEGPDHSRLPALDSRLVVFIDEIDVVQSLPFPSDEFFAAIRECYNRRAVDRALDRLTFCLLGAAAPTDLVRDTRITPFNIGRRIELEDFGADEAGPLAGGLKRDERARRSLLRRILHWTGGHPYLTQCLCKAVACSAEVRSARDVDRLCRDMFLSHRARERDDNLVFVRERLLRGGQDPAGLLELYRQVWRGRRVRDDEADQRVGLLRLSGIVRSCGGVLCVRNRVYERVFDPAWVREHMPDAEVRRQRAAYRRGALRTAGAAAAIVLVMAGLVATALGFARRADRNARLAEHNRAEADDKATEAQRLANQLQGAVQERDRALARMVDAVRAESKGRTDARQAARGARASASLALRERDHARAEKARADAAVHAGRESLVRLTVATGQRALDDGYPAGALLWFVRALQMDRGRPAREAVDRLRIGMLLEELGAPPGRAGAPPRRLSSSGTCASFSADGRRLIVGESDGRARIWDTVTWREACPPLRHGTRVQEATFSPDASVAATAGQDGRACLWDTRTGRLVRSFDHPSQALAVAFSVDGRLLATMTGEAAYVWELATGRSLWTIPTGVGALCGGAISPDFRRLLTYDRAGRAEIRGLTAGRAGPSGLWHAPQVQAAGFSPDGGRVAIGGPNHAARVCDARTGRPLAPVLRHSAGVGQVCFSPDGRRLATTALGSESGGPTEARIWDASTGSPVTPPLPHRRAVRAIGFSPDGSLLATGCNDHTARLWDAATGEPVTVPLEAPGEVYCAAVSRGNRCLLTASNDGSVDVWNLVATRRRPAELMAMAEAYSGRHIDPKGSLSPVDPASLPQFRQARQQRRANGAAEPAQDARDHVKALLARLEGASGPPEPLAPAAPAALAGPSRAPTQMWDAARDFSAARNPNGAWSYGARQAQSDFTLYGWRDRTEAGGDTWRIAPGTDPCVHHNGTGYTIARSGGLLQWPAGSLSLHPAVVGIHLFRSVVRWTAPAAGRYRIAAAFYGLDRSPTTTDVHVVVGGRLAFDDLVEGAGSRSARLFCQTVDLAAGARIDFVVGVGRDGGMESDTTALEARITWMAAAARRAHGPSAVP